MSALEIKPKRHFAQTELHHGVTDPFLVPFFASQVLLVIASLSRGRVAQGSADIILYAFLALQALLAAILIWRFRDSRMAASALAVFSLCYALFASFVATNAMANSWL